MSDDFPQWWSPPDGDPVSILEAALVPEGWVRRHGHYNTQIGQFVEDEPAPADPFDHDGDGKPGGSKPKAKRKGK